MSNPARICSLSVVAALVALLAPPLAAAPPAESAGANRAAEQFFERKVRPVLVEHCQSCHAGEKHKGGLRVDSLQALLEGGDGGPALAPGSPEKSRMIAALSWTDDNLKMPPKKKLPDAAIADLMAWVKAGAVWPGDGAVAAAKPRGMVVTDADRQYWAYRPVVRPAVPASRAGVAANPIDAFVLARLEGKGLAQNPPATKRELIRRAYFDLIGLPPTPEAVARFEADTASDAYDKVVDELLSRPQYGERWGRHWLDVARFAQTNGYEYDQEKPFAGKYRDYVIASFNADKPYDRFVREQLAGDELADATDESLIATGFYRVGLWDFEPDDNRAAEFDDLDDTVVAAGAAFLGTTFGCARCHDHKLDPIPHEDYYRLLAFFRNVRRYDGSNLHAKSAGLVILGGKEASERYEADIRAQLRPLQEKLAAAKDAKQKKAIEADIARVNRERAGPNEWALAVREGPTKPTHVLLRGNPGMPGAEVQPGFPSVLGGKSAAVVAPPSGSSSGRRLALANWIASPDNPLTARVMVNRVWHHHFGRGIARTTADFGKGGIPPTHPDLLDWLAAEFVHPTGPTRPWSVKQLHRTIMLSQTYRMSSRAGEATALAADPGNDLFWRQNLRRLDAEAIRDSVLAVSGTLNPAAGGRGFYPHVAVEVLAGGSRPGDGWGVSPPEERARRSVYAYIKRSMLPPIFEGFDYSTTSQPLTERQTTTVAPQALMLLNDKFMHDQSTAFAARLRAEVGPEPAKLVERLYERALGRKPTPRDRETALSYLARQAKSYSALSDRLTFAPDVHVSLHSSYLKAATGEGLLVGPSAGWSYHKGTWTGGYSGIMTTDRLRGPFALWNGPAFVDGTVEAKVSFPHAMNLASVLLRGTAVTGAFTGYRGYQVVFDVRDRALSVQRAGEEMKVIGKAHASFPLGRPFPMKATIAGGRVQVWIDGAAGPALDVTDPDPLAAPGRFGVRSWGAAVSLDGLRVTEGGRTLDVATHRPEGPAPLEAASEATGLPVGWKAFGGEWTIADEALAVEPNAGAKAVWSGPTFSDGMIEAKIMLKGRGGDAGLLVRAARPAAGMDAVTAYNVNFTGSLLRLGRHRNDWKALAVVPFKMDTERWHAVRVQLEGGRIRVFVDGAAEPQLDFTDPEPLLAGKVGMRTFKAKFALKDLAVTADGKTTAAAFVPTAKVQPTALSASKPADAVAGPTAEDKALAALCLVVMNLNEFAYVD